MRFCLHGLCAERHRLSQTPVSKVWEQCRFLPFCRLDATPPWTRRSTLLVGAPTGSCLTPWSALTLKPSSGRVCVPWRSGGKKESKTLLLGLSGVCHMFCSHAGASSRQEVRHDSCVVVTVPDMLLLVSVWVTMLPHCISCGSGSLSRRSHETPLINDGPFQLQSVYFLTFKPSVLSLLPIFLFSPPFKMTHLRFFM